MNAEDNARAALRKSMEMNGDPRRAEREVPEGASALMRMVDFRVPLVWLLGGFIAAIFAFANMYFQLQRVSEALIDLQRSVSTATTVNAATISDITLLKYRMDSMESAVTRITVIERKSR